MEKHAYMIIAHNQFDVLEKLIRLLDDERNDIYIHIDKKVKKFDFERFKSIPLKSNIFFTPRIKVNWGGYSQVQCELILLKEAVKHGYQYYHLLSGADLPLKTQDAIHAFFDSNAGKEFILLSSDEYEQKVYLKLKQRISLYYTFQEHLSDCKIKYVQYIFRLINKVFLILQKIIKIDRIKDADFKLKYGSQWFSITNALACYVIGKEDWIRDIFSKSLCSDELFLATIVFNSDFKNEIYRENCGDNYSSSMRKIDWKRGNPYVWKKGDFNELIDSKFLFARKFSASVDNDVIDSIYQYLKYLNEHSIQEKR